MLFFSPLTQTLSLPSGNEAKSIWQTRTQLVIKTLLATFAIGLANRLTQQITRNVVADVSVLGATALQQMLLIILMLVVPTFVHDDEQTWSFSLVYLGCSLLGSCLFVTLIKKHALSSSVILVYGVILNVVITAVAYCLLAINPNATSYVAMQFNDYVRKTFGGVQLVSDWSGVAIDLTLLLICLGWMFLLRWKIIALSTNPLRLTSLNLSVTKTMWQTTIIISVLAGIAFHKLGFVAFLGVCAGFLGVKFLQGFFSSTIGSGLIAVCFGLVALLIKLSLVQVAATLSSSVVTGGVCFVFLLILLFWQKHNGAQF